MPEEENEIEHGYLKDAADFYENRHTNSDLIAVNFTQYSDDEVYEALYNANMKLIKRYQEVQNRVMEDTCHDLYINKNAGFRGFRQT